MANVKSEHYLDVCYEAWKSVFDSYDQLLRTFRSLAPTLSDELNKELKEIKRQIELKRQVVETAYEDSLVRVHHCDANIQDTSPVAAKIDFSLARCLRAAWPIEKVLAAASTGLQSFSPPFESAASSVPPPDREPSPSNPPKTNGLDRVYSWVQSVSSTAQPASDSAAKPVPAKPVKTELDDFDDEFDTFDSLVPSVSASQQDVPALAKPVLQTQPKTSLDDFDDFEPFDKAISPPPVPAQQVAPTGPKVSPRKQQQPQQQQQKKAVPVEASHPQIAIRLPEGDPAKALETMRCINFLTNKIKAKYSDKRETPLTKVYGHLAEERAYRLLIGGLREFPDFLLKHPDYFRLNAKQDAVSLVAHSWRRSGDAVKLAKKAADEAARNRRFRNSESPEPPRSKPKTVKVSEPPVLQRRPVSVSVPRTMLDMDDYGDDDDDEELLGPPRAASAGGHLYDMDTYSDSDSDSVMLPAVVQTGQNDVDDDDDDDAFGGGTVAKQRLPDEAGQTAAAPMLAGGAPAPGRKLFATTCRPGQ